MLIGANLNNLCNEKKENKMLYYSETNLLAFISPNKEETGSSGVT